MKNKLVNLKIYIHKNKQQVKYINKKLQQQLKKVKIIVKYLHAQFFVVKFKKILYCKISI